MAFLSYTQNAFLKWREGLLASPLWMGWEQVMMNLFGAPGGKAFWKERGYMFGDEFRRYVESDLMKESRIPTQNRWVRLALLEQILPTNHTQTQISEGRDQKQTDWRCFVCVAG